MKLAVISHASYSEMHFKRRWENNFVFSFRQSEWIFINNAHPQIIKNMIQSATTWVHLQVIIMSCNNSAFTFFIIININ